MINRYSLIACIIVLFVFGSCLDDNYTDDIDPSGFPACNLQEIDYSTVIRPIINANCAITGCHGANPANDFDMTTYLGVKAAAGSIKNRINREFSDPLFMPQGFRMNDCDHKKLNAWLDAGAPQ